MCFLMPEFHDGLDDPFCLTVGPGRLDLRNVLFDSVFPTKSQAWCSGSPRYSFLLSL